MHPKLEAIFERQYADAVKHRDSINMLIIERAFVSELIRELHTPRDGEIRGDYTIGDTC